MKDIHLAFDFSWTNVETQWRQPDSIMGLEYPSPGLFEEIARLAERGGLDMIYFRDGTGIPDTWENGIEDAARYGSPGHGST
jgi:alkanesulfonate monooxygenase SsuD/methylene tetrahydromethanopterin reductase-like flavin-dependent oxidoreductase (luciferase family)